MRGAAPLCTPRFSLSTEGGVGHPGLLQDWQSLHPPAGAPPCTRVTFPSRGKSPKARQGLRPLESPRCEVAALFALAYASRRATSCHNKRPICHFERVGKSVLFFSSSYTGGHTLSCQSVVRQVDLVSADGPEWHPFLGGAATPLGG